MEVITIGLIVIVGGFFLLKRRVHAGKRFVKAFYFLKMLSMGETVESANQVAVTLFANYSDPDVDHRIAVNAKNYSQSQYGGKQLPIIAEAQTKGFTG